MNPSSLLFSGLRVLFEMDLLSVGYSAALLGALLHGTLFRTSFPIEDYLEMFLGLYASTVLSVVFSFLLWTDLSPFQILTRVGLSMTSFNTGMIISIVIYRLFFHRLHRFPGPVVAKLSRFYDACLAAKHIQYNVEIAKLHHTYGDFIRTGPREVCIVRKSAVPLIYGPRSECLKSTWYGQVSTDYKKCSIHMTRNVDDHRKRRKAWDQGFSTRALRTYEPRVKAKADQLVSQIEARLDKPLDITAWSMFLTFDIMGDVGFGKDFHNLTTGIEHPAIKGIHDHMHVLGILSHVPWCLNLLSRIPGATAGYSAFFQWCAEEIESKRKSWDRDQYPQDIVSWLLKAFVDRDISASPSKASLHEDARVVIIAGSETTATTLTSALYYLTKHPAVLIKLQSYLDTALPPGTRHWTYDQIKDITYIDDIINETLRLRPALMTGGYRVTPPQGLQVDEVHIPGDVNVFVPVQLIQMDSRYYKAAEEFIPERWGERREEMRTEEAPFLPFSLGSYGCPGKNLAMLSLRIAISSIAQRYHLIFASSETEETFENGALDTFTTTLPPLQIRFQRR
ncbi:monooxygenase [Aspergillus coremiiformis]|uniref:Monooxygenase n=1 Tax=Aspergillus coremiiformis TaxID=138285 RepID=A0A5N6Z7P0_9EURO|nr:monooxygenase [Aspergillus coremiiformis]